MPRRARIDAPRTSSPSLRVRLALALLTAFALAVRLVSIDYGLPHRIEPDGEIAQQVQYLRSEKQTIPLASAYATYPRLVAHLAAAVFAAPPDPRDVQRASAAEHLRYASKDYVDARITAALLSALIVPATFFLARRFTEPRFALLAAALVAGSLLGTVFGRQARPHGPAAALVACAVLTHLRLLERPSLTAWIAVGAVTALAIGTLQSAVALAFPLAAAHFLRPRRAWLDARALIALALIVVGAVAAYASLSHSVVSGIAGVPEVPGEQAGSEDGGFVSLERGWLSFGNHRIELMRFGGQGLQVVARTLWWYEPGLAGLLVVAALLWIAERPLARGSAPRRQALVVAAYLVPYLTVLALFNDTFERFVLPALPFLACFAAWGAAAAARRFGPRAAAILMLPALVGCASSARLALLHSRPDTLEEAADWVRAHIGPDEPVFLSPLPSYILKDSSIDLPLLRQEVALTGLGGSRAASYNVWSHYQRRLPEGAAPEPRYLLRWLILRMPVVTAKHPGIAGRKLAYWKDHPEVFFEETGPGYFIVEDHRLRPENTGDIALQDALARLGTRLARFEPDDTGFPFDYQDRVQEGGDWPHVTWRTLTARTTGPALEVWHVSAERLAAEE